MQPAPSLTMIRFPAGACRLSMPASAGINILRFDFRQTTAPADVDPHSSDHRPLAARVFEVSVGSASSGPDDAHLLRLDEGDNYLDETSAWRRERGRPLPPD